MAINKLYITFLFILTIGLVSCSEQDLQTNQELNERLWQEYPDAQILAKELHKLKGQKVPSLVDATLNDQVINGYVVLDNTALIQEQLATELGWEPSTYQGPFYLTFSVVVKDGAVKDVVLQPHQDPTIVIASTESVIRETIAADNPLNAAQAALEAGAITISSQEVFTSLKLASAKASLQTKFFTNSHATSFEKYDFLDEAIRLRSTPALAKGNY